MAEWQGSPNCPLTASLILCTETPLTHRFGGCYSGGASLMAKSKPGHSWPMMMK